MIFTFISVLIYKFMFISSSKLICMCDLYIYIGILDYIDVCMFINIYVHFEVDIIKSIVCSILKMVGTRGKKTNVFGKKTPAATECRTSSKSRFLHVNVR